VKHLMLILFCIFGLQNDSTKVDTTRMQQSISIQKKVDKTNSKLDSIIAILQNDTIKR
jgi:hypothetical protein